MAGINTKPVFTLTMIDFQRGVMGTSLDTGSQNIFARYPDPTQAPTGQPSSDPSRQPSKQPTARPTSNPSEQPTEKPSDQPDQKPSIRPTLQPNSKPSRQPLTRPSSRPSRQPVRWPSSLPSTQPSSVPTKRPSHSPTRQPAQTPTRRPTLQVQFFLFFFSNPSYTCTYQPARFVVCSLFRCPLGSRFVSQWCDLLVNLTDRRVAAPPASLLGGLSADRRSSQLGSRPVSRRPSPPTGPRHSHLGNQTTCPQVDLA